MLTRPKSARLRSVNRPPVAIDQRSVAADWAGRLIRIALSLYLIPALLAVLAVGVVGMLVITVAHLFMGPVHRPVG